MRQNRRFTVVGVVLLAAGAAAGRANPREEIPPPRLVEPRPARQEEPRWAPAAADSPLRKVTLPVRAPQVVREERQVPSAPASPKRLATGPVTPARLAAEAVKTGPPPAKPVPVVRPAPPAPGDSIVIVGGVAVPIPPDPPARRGP